MMLNLNRNGDVACSTRVYRIALSDSLKYYNTLWIQKRTVSTSTPPNMPGPYWPSLADVWFFNRHHQCYLHREYYFLPIYGANGEESVVWESQIPGCIPPQIAESGRCPNEIQHTSNPQLKKHPKHSKRCWDEIYQGIYVDVDLSRIGRVPERQEWPRQQDDERESASPTFSSSGKRLMLMHHSHDTQLMHNNLNGPTNPTASWLLAAWHDNMAASTSTIHP